MMPDFERWLEGRFNRDFAAVQARPRPAPRYRGAGSRIAGLRLALPLAAVLLGGACGVVAASGQRSPQALGEYVGQQARQYTLQLAGLVAELAHQAPANRGRVEVGQAIPSAVTPAATPPPSAQSVAPRGAAPPSAAPRSASAPRPAGLSPAPAGQPAPALAGSSPPSNGAQATAPPPDQTVQQQPAQSAQTTQQQSQGGFPAPLPSGSFSR